MQRKTIVLYVFYHSFIPSFIFLKERYSLKKKSFHIYFFKGGTIEKLIRDVVSLLKTFKDIAF